MADEKPTEQSQQQPPLPVTQESIDEDGATQLSSLSPAEQQSFNQAIFAQLSVQQTMTVLDPSTAASQPIDSVHHHRNPDTQTNRHTIRCRFCDTKILLPDASTYESKEYDLHLLCGSKDDPTTETLRDFWFVPSQMNFENVGVTRSVDPSYRYLTCANCDRGPIGINYLNQPTKFYVAHARVKYDP